ncbi:hypothetical protein [Mesorhizobium amorphae]|uniref:hypothetical protein n=1 Tax=Mesorhizobium amorphae TaxID=71433 RepID=UPI0011870424|nr:hypothetical protein [Mesorhizobium amorphae]
MTPEFLSAMILKLEGSLAGAIVALVFVPPRTKSGFFRRSIVALICGVAFAPVVRFKAGFSDDAEGLFAAACLAAFVSWWFAGAIKRAAEAWQSTKPAKEE